MKILILTHYFPPEIGAPQARLSEFARSWAEAGDDVTVLTGMPNHPTGEIPAEYRGAIRRDELVDGYRVVRTWMYATPNERFAKKLFNHLSFMFSSIILGVWKVGRPDVVVISSPTFFSIFSAWLVARLRRSRLVVEVRDLWPAIFVELGVLTNPLLIRLLERVELAAYRAADHVVVVSDGFKEHIVYRGIPREKITTIPNGVDLERFDHESEEEPWVRTWLDVSEHAVLVLYIGAHGISHALPAVARAAHLVEAPNIVFGFVGEGAAKDELAQTVADLGATNVRMRPGVKRDYVPAILSAADICLVPLRDVPLFRTFIPSKIFEYLGAGRAVIGALRGESAAILEQAGGVVVEPENPIALARAVTELAYDRERRHRMGMQGRAYVQRHFDRRCLAAQYRLLLRAVATGRGRSS